MSIKPLNADVFIKKVGSANLIDTFIHVEGNDDDTLKVFEVLAVGEKVIDVKVGDQILIPWTRVTPPIDMPHYGICGITSEEEIFAVVEKSA